MANTSTIKSLDELVIKAISAIRKSQHQQQELQVTSTTSQQVQHQQQELQKLQQRNLYNHQSQPFQVTKHCNCRKE